MKKIVYYSKMRVHFINLDFLHGVGHIKGKDQNQNSQSMELILKKKKKVFGFIHSITDESHFQYIDRLDSDCFIKFLKAILKIYAGSNHIYIVINNAHGHRSKKVDKFVSLHSSKLTLIKLPPYSPDLNPIEIVWREVKKDVVYNTFYPFVEDFHNALL